MVFEKDILEILECFGAEEKIVIWCKWAIITFY